MSPEFDDDVVAVDVLFTSEGERFIAGFGLARDAQVHRVEAETDELGTVAVAPAPHRRYVIFG